MKNIIIGIAGGTGSGKSTFTRKLKKEFKDDVAVLYHDNYYRDQSDIPLEVRKKTNYDHPDAMETELLVQQLMELKEEIMAFGDGDNDIDMLRYAHIGVAMGNAGENVKTHADYVTACVDDDGIYKALKVYGLL